MIKKLRVTVDGVGYDVLVELADDAGAAPMSPPPPSVASAPLSLGSVTSAPAPASSSGATAAAGAGDVPSPLAGRVTAVNVQAGQDVKEGDHLLTLEAMKMNTFVMAPRAGKVKEVRVSVGSAVEEGQALVTLE
jgi:biotin carboxyl carrier protein